jgi:hypothetical protein
MSDYAFIAQVVVIAQGKELVHTLSPKHLSWLSSGNDSLFTLKSI